MLAWFRLETDNPFERTYSGLEEVVCLIIRLIIFSDSVYKLGQTCTAMDHPSNGRSLQTI